jgi:outer membrane biosynthesis protein TonB
MAFNEQRNKNKAKVWTVIVHLLLMLWFAFYGLTYQDPPPEEGIAINFGYEETGAGENTQAAPTIPPPTPETPVETPPVKEEVVTQDVEDAPVIESIDGPTPTKPKEVLEQTKEETEKPKKPVQEPEPDPQPTAEELERQRQQERLNRMFNTTRDETGQGEGETTGGGDQGDPNGDPLSPNRNEGTGTGNSGDYNLNGREVLDKIKPKNNCNKEGTIVVMIRVDSKGIVSSVLGGVNIPNGPQSDITNSCLLPLAEAAAKRTTWTPKPGADLQVGYIVYVFEIQ